MTTETKLPLSLFRIGFAVGLVAVLAATAMLTGCHRNIGSTVYQGPIVFPDTTIEEPYYALVPHLDPPDPYEKWMRWEPWEMQDYYHLKAEPGETYTCMFIGKISGDTLGTYTITGVRGKQKIYQDTLLLDGSHYFRGVKNEKR